MAPIPANHARVSLHWIPSDSAWPGEQAVNSFHVSYVDNTPPAQWSAVTQQIADKVAAVLTAHWAPVGTYVGSGYQIDQVKVAALDTSNHTTEEAVHAFTAGTLVGSASGGILPPEVSVAVSLYGYQPGSFQSRRGTKRGRLFLPYIASTAAGGDGKLTSSARNGILNAWSQVFTDLFNATVADGNFQAVILSPTAGTSTTINYLAVDDHFDSQRRRQHQSPALRSVQQIPMAG